MICIRWQHSFNGILYITRNRNKKRNKLVVLKDTLVIGRDSQDGPLELYSDTLCFHGLLFECDCYVAVLLLLTSFLFPTNALTLMFHCLFVFSNLMQLLFMIMMTRPVFHCAPLYLQFLQSLYLCCCDVPWALENVV